MSQLLQLLNRQALENGQFADTLPELYRLQTVTEQSDWHNDTPFAQSIRLMRYAKNLPDSLTINTGVSASALKAWLSATTGDQSNQTLLALAALLHDIGKHPTFTQLPDGTTRCPNHEVVGAALIPAICNRLALDPAQTRFVHRLITTHGEPYALHKKIAPLSAKKRQAQRIAFEKTHADILKPLLLLAWGDVATSHLPNRNPAKYAAVINFYQPWLERCWAKKPVRRPMQPFNPGLKTAPAE